jgi:hypothetical protein
MIHANDAATAAATRFSRRSAEGPLIWRSEFFRRRPRPPSSIAGRPRAGGFVPYDPPAPGEVREPQAFLVEQEPGIVHPHFHHADQFQVVVGAAAPSASTRSVRSRPFRRRPYGLRADHAGAAGPALLRCGPAPTAPAPSTCRARASDADVPRCNVFARRSHRPPAGHDRADPVQVETLLEEADGLSFRYVRIAPDTDAVIDGMALGAGQSILVTQGAVRHEGAVLSSLGALFVPPDQATLAVRSGADGADLLVLRYPRAG